MLLNSPEPVLNLLNNVLFSLLVESCPNVKCYLSPSVTDQILH